MTINQRRKVALQETKKFLYDGNSYLKIMVKATSHKKNLIIKVIIILLIMIQMTMVTIVHSRRP